MIDRKTLFKCTLAALLGAAALEPTSAGAAACAGPAVNWGQESNTFGNLQCGRLTSRGRSKGGFSRLPSGQQIATSLDVRLDSGIHASGIAYNSVGSVMANCDPFDDTPGNGGVSVGSPGCLGGAKHQVIVVF